VCVGGRWLDGGRSTLDRIGDMRPPPPPPASHSLAAAATGPSSSSVTATQNVGNLLHMAGGFMLTSWCSLLVTLYVLTSGTTFHEYNIKG
jgi:hypothetical protein